MKKLILLCAIVSMNFIQADAQGSRSGTTNTLILASPQASLTKAGSDFWASGGAGVAEAGLSSSPMTNPAALSLSSTIIRVELGKSFAANWLLDFDYNDHFVLPSFVSIGMPFGDWSIAVGYANTYSQRLSTSIAITTENQPQGTGQLGEYEKSVNVHTFFGSASYPVSQQLSIGITAGLSYLASSEHLLNVSANGSGIGAMLVVGVLAKPTQAVSIGSTLKYSTPISFSAHYGSSLFIAGAVNDSNFVALLPEEYRFEAAFPWRWELGGSVEFLPNAKFLASMEYQHWSNVSDTYKNLWLVHVGTVFPVSPTLSLRFGFFTQNEPSTAYPTSLDQKFLTAGFQLMASENVSVSATILDSHIFGSEKFASFFGNSSQEFHQTYISGSIDYSLR